MWKVDDRCTHGYVFIIEHVGCILMYTYDAAIHDSSVSVSELETAVNKYLVKL